MPEYPKKEAIGKSKLPLFDANVPVWHSLNGNVLLNNGWTKVGNLYLKDNMTLEYTGVHWILNAKTRVDFLEEIQQELKNDKGV